VVRQCCAIGTKIVPSDTKIAMPHAKVAPSGNIERTNIHYYARKKD
jgi:hypothetical protein